jgi:hypothetical protein
MLLTGKIPNTWNISVFEKLKYNVDPDPEIHKEYLSAGYSIDNITISNCFEYNFDFDTSHILKEFNFLKSISLAVNLFHPGQYIPLHSDRYEKFKKFHNLPPEQSIVRLVLMLEDSALGQILQIKDICTSSWKAGDCFGWKYDDPHAFYNFSMNDRYAIQVTGVTK